MKKKKSLGTKVVWVCGACDKIIRTHTTTLNIATYQHRQMEKRLGNESDLLNKSVEIPRCSGAATDQEILEYAEKLRTKSPSRH